MTIVDIICSIGIISFLALCWVSAPKATASELAAQEETSKDASAC